MKVIMEKTNWVGKGIDVKTQALLLTLCMLCNEDKEVWETQKQIAAFMGMSSSNVSKSMKVLFSTGFVESADRGAYKINKFIEAKSLLR